MCLQPQVLPVVQLIMQHKLIPSIFLETAHLSPTPGFSSSHIEYNIHSCKTYSQVTRNFMQGSISRNIWSFEPEVTTSEISFLDIQSFKNPAVRVLSYWPLSQFKDPASRALSYWPPSQFKNPASRALLLAVISRLVPSYFSSPSLHVGASSYRFFKPELHIQRSSPSWPKMSSQD